jgi:probable rRNA maturation factor
MNAAENIRIEFDCDSDDDIDIPRLEKLIRSLCVECGVLDAYVQVSVVGDAEMTDLHRQFLNEDTTTDVISFDLSDEFEPGRHFQIVVNRQQAARQADKRGHDTLCELALYMIHGLLHQAGYDDRDPAQARRMHEKEDAILQAGGFGVIYHNEEKTQE